MPTIEISTLTYEKLQKLGVAFVDTPETVIARLADAALAQTEKSLTPTSSAAPRPDWMELEPIAGILAHTRVLFARFGGQEIDPPQWNNLLRVAHIEALKKLGSYAAVKEASSARLKEGRVEDRGFKYVPEARFSIQGLDSNQSWASSLRLAKRLGVPIEVGFEWYEKEGAAYPGKRGHMHWQPSDR